MTGRQTPELSASNASTSGQGSKQSTTDPQPKPPGVSIIAHLSTVTAVPQQSNTGCLIQPLAVKNRKRDVATATPSRPTKAHRLPYRLEQENRGPLPSASPRPQIDGNTLVYPLDNTPGVWDTQQESPLTKQLAPLCVLQQIIENPQGQAQTKPRSSVSKDTKLSTKQSVEAIRYEHSSSSQFQSRLKMGQLLPQTAALKPAERLDVIQEFTTLGPAMQEPPSSAVGGGTLPESASTDTPKNLPARRLRKRRNPEITTATANAIPSPPRQPSVERNIVPVRVTRAFAAGTRPTPTTDGPYVRRYAKKSEIVTESTLPKFSMPTSTFDPDTIVLQYTGKAKVAMQSTKIMGDKEQTGDLSRTSSSR
ncbi:hypothetical protein BGX38DRAFT_601351 [Terfezia claveryi]|nr:hypothetical protein BGX38DRAFT_601351 [Terfezia claveryi]